MQAGGQAYHQHLPFSFLGQPLVHIL